MLDLPAGLTLSIVLLTITTFGCFLFAAVLSSNTRMQRSATLIGIVILLWIIFQSTLSLNRWYMDRKSLHLLFPYLTTLIITLAVSFLPVMKDFRESLHRPTLIWMQLLRLPMHGLVYWSVLHKQSPAGIWIYPLIADLIAIAAIPIILRALRSSDNNSGLLRVWHIFGSITLMSSWVIMLLSAPSAMQQLAFQSPNYLIVHFPGSWIPSVIIPLLLFGHISQWNHPKG